MEVRFAGQKKQATANGKGYWRVTLDPLATCCDNRTLEAQFGEKTVSITNVLVGEVWLAAGQSNMNVAGPDEDTGVYPHFVSPGTKGGKPDNNRFC